MFSKACEYGIRAAIHISSQSQKNECVSLKSIARAIDSPLAFTAKILQSLAKNEIITSSHGPTGGYEMLMTKRSKITLFHIVEAIDGDRTYNGCGLGLAKCNASKPCPAHFQFVAVRNKLKTMLKDTTIGELANRLDDGESYLKR